MKKRDINNRTPTKVRHLRQPPGERAKASTTANIPSQSNPTQPLNPDNALVIGRLLGNDQLSRRQLAGVFMALLRCDNPVATKQILHNILEGIVTTDPEATRSPGEFTVEVSDLADLREIILGL